MKISSQIQMLESSVSIVACFESLCGVYSISQLLKILPELCSVDDATIIVTGQLQNVGASGGQGVTT